MPKPSKKPDGEKAADQVKAGKATDLSDVGGTLSTASVQKEDLDELEANISNRRKPYGPDIDTDDEPAGALSDSAGENVDPTDPTEPASE